jgi:glycosyltransferase involved in cell wall biosynthesis
MSNGEPSSYRGSAISSEETGARDVDVYLVGLPYSHHSRHSGYEGFGRYVGNALPTLGFRYFERAWRVDVALSALVRKPCYSVALLAGEAATALQMLRHPSAVYHFIYGDTDVHLLPRLSRVTRTPVVATFHEPDVGLEWLKVDRSLTDRLAAVILVSASQRPHFERFVAPDRLFVIPHGIDTTFFRPAESASDERLCITVGSKFRDFETLSEAITIVHEQDPQVRFVAVGADRDKRHVFRDERVEHLREVTDEELRAAYQRAAIAILPLTQATANNALLEAMACGLPVVATGTGGIREYIGEDGAILCEPRDSSALAHAILRLLDDRPLARRMGARNRERALRFDFKAVAALHLRAYEAVAAERRHRPRRVRRLRAAAVRRTVGVSNGAPGGD